MLSQLLKLSTYRPTAFHITAPSISLTSISLSQPQLQGKATFLTVQPLVSVLSSHLQNIPSSLSVQTLSLTRWSEHQNATLSLPNQRFQSFLNSTPPLAKSPATLSPWQPLMTSQPSTTLFASPLQQTSSVHPLGNSQSKGFFFFTLPIRLFLHPSTHPHTHPPIHLSIYPPIHPSIHPSIHHPPIHSSIHPSTHACMHPSNHASIQKIHSFIHPSIRPCIHACMHAYYASIHSYIDPSIHRSMHLSMHPCTHPCIHPCIHLYIHPCIQHACVHPSIHPFFCSLPPPPPPPEQNS